MKSSARWNLTLRERVTMLRTGTHKVAYFAPRPDFASFRYRCHNPTQALNKHSSRVSASYFYLSDLAHIPDLTELADTLVVFRTPYDTDVHRVITQFVRVGKKVFYDIDDLVFDVSFAPLVTSNLNANLWGEDIVQWFAFIANIGACMKLTDHVITTNAYIAERASDFSGLPVTVIPNFVNDEQLATSAEVVEKKSLTRSTSGLKLGYFSGSHSHAKDFAVASRAIADFLRDSPQSTLKILGHLELPGEMEGVRSQVIKQGFTDFIELQSAVGSVDVNLVPLQMSPFTFSKSELKYFEAAIVKTITLASPTPLYRSLISEGVNGFLAHSGQWRDKLHLIQQLTCDERSNIATRAHAHAMERYSPSHVVADLEKLFLSETRLST